MFLLSVVKCHASHQIKTCHLLYTNIHYKLRLAHNCSHAIMCQHFTHLYPEKVKDWTNFLSVGEVFHDFIPQQLTFNEAQSYCRAAGAELATTAQLYLAWSEGLDHCSPGWLSDGSVRYPIITPRERCGGALPGVKTLYQFSNQTGFPEPSSLHDVYCFKGDNVVPLNANCWLLIWQKL